MTRKLVAMLLAYAALLADDADQTGVHRPIVEVIRRARTSDDGVLLLEAYLSRYIAYRERNTLDRLFYAALNPGQRGLVVFLRWLKLPQLFIVSRDPIATPPLQTGATQASNRRQE